MRRFGQHTDGLGENPALSVKDQALYWIDIRGARVRGHAHGSKTLENPGDCWIGGAWPRKLACPRTEIPHCAVRAGPGRFQTIVAPEADNADHQFNDGKCDSQACSNAGP